MLTFTSYEYDIMQRLLHLQTKSLSANEVLQDIKYEYDNVSNILNVTNDAQTLSNGLGGAYGYNFSYNELYRLTEANGWEVNGAQYDLYMDYTANGKIKSKALNINNSSACNHSYNYNSGNNQLVGIQSTHQYFNWDANGNMTFHANHPGGYGNRHLCWDEANRLRRVHDEERCSYYLYAAGGGRALKLAGEMMDMNINGQYMTMFMIHEPTLYFDAYLVMNDKGYTKHYYTGSERIASKIGGGAMANTPSLVPQTTFEEKVKFNSDALRKYLMDCPPRQADDFAFLQEFIELDELCEPEAEYYFYHTDHLGSSSWITNQDGKAVQHLQYLPFGESWIDQRNGSWNAPYTFSGKERDWETSYSYFGARYYDSDLSIWLSVDPRASSYPGLTPYNYCANNPVNLIDPNGESMKWWGWLAVGLGLFCPVTATTTVATAAATTAGIAVTVGVTAYSTTTLNAPFLAIGGAIAHACGSSVTADQLVRSSYRMTNGLFVTDKNKSFLGRVWEFTSRFSYQGLQTVIGLSFATAACYGGQVDEVDYYGGVTTLSGNYFGQGGAITFGNYIAGNDIKADPEDWYFQHEYGHYIQSQQLGALYLPCYGIPSLISAGMDDGRHKYLFIEQDANALAYKYFSKHVPGFNGPNGSSKWFFNSHPIFGHNAQTALDMKYGCTNFLGTGVSMWQILGRKIAEKFNIKY